MSGLIKYKREGYIKWINKHKIKMEGKPDQYVEIIDTSTHESEVKEERLLIVKKSQSNITHTEAFKEVLQYLNKWIRIRLRLLNKRAAYSHIPCFLNSLTTPYIQMNESFTSFLAAGIQKSNIHSLRVEFSKSNFGTKVPSFLEACNLLGDRVENLKVDFEKRSVPSAEQNELIGSGISKLIGLKNLSISGAIQAATLDAIIENCKPAQTFKQVIKLEIDFDSVKKTTLENFASLFSSEALRSLTITKRNVNIFPYLVENKIKVNHLHLEMPLAALIPYMNKFLHFTQEELVSLKVTQEGSDTQEEVDKVLKQYRIHTYFEFPCLRKLHLINVQEIMLRDIMRKQALVRTHLTDVNLEGMKKSDVFYTHYIPHFLCHGALEHFTHDITSDNDISKFSISAILKMIDQNIRSLKTITIRLRA